MVRKIKELCKSRSPSVKKVLKVAKYFGVKIDYLMEKEVQQ